ncbi:MAG: enoyl-CoA hydratase/isomerase family protein [Burkholderiaceae bacterium]
MTDDVLCRREHGALWITLNRPAALNAITPAVTSDIARALDEVEDDPQVNAVVLTATGHAFCAGADLKYVRQSAAGDESAVKRFLLDILRLMDRLERFPKPVIAAVNGMALAGGLELVLCCDLVIAARSARLGDAHANYGLLPGGGGSVRLPRKIGPTQAKYLMFTGEFETAEWARQAGLVNEVVDDAALEAAAVALVCKLQTKSSLVLWRMKALVDDGLQQTPEAALRTELLVSELRTHSHDWAEGLAAFEEKRTPRFIGR